MIVYSRRQDEAIVIPYHGQEISITVVSVQGDKVRLGITAPRSIPVHRGEVFEMLSQEWPERVASRREGGRRVDTIPLAEHQRRWLDELTQRAGGGATPAAVLERILDAVASWDLDWESLADLDGLEMRLRALGNHKPSG